MPIELSHLMQLVAGTRTSLDVGSVPHEVAQHFGFLPGIVFLGHREVVKIAGKHGERVRVEQLQNIWRIVRDGEYRMDVKRSSSLTIYFEEGVTIWVLAINMRPKGELWVDTLYASGEKKQRNQRSRAVLIKRQAKS